MFIRPYIASGYVLIALQYEKDTTRKATTLSGLWYRVNDFVQQHTHLNGERMRNK